MRYTSLRMKRNIVIGLALLLAVSTAFAASFSDINTYKYKSAVETLTDWNVVEGYPDGTYRPNQHMNRAEFLKILIAAEHPSRVPPSDLRCFDDFQWDGAAPWYAAPVCTGKSLGIVSGYPDDTFRPEQTVNLAEAIKMTSLSLGFAPRNLVGNEPWYAPYVDLAREAAALTPLLNDPAHLLTRGEMAELTVRFIEKRTADGDGVPDGTTPAVCGNGNVEKGEQCDDGNQLNGDGCSEICISVPEPIRHGALRVSQESSALVTSASAGKQDVPLLRFSALAGRQDVNLNGLTFLAGAGSLEYARNFTLTIDGNGDGTYETNVQNVGRAEGSRLVFDDLDVLLQDGELVDFQVEADIVQTTGPVSLSLAFATDDARYVSAIGAVDGRELTGIETDGDCPGNQICWVTVSLRESGVIEISERGNLYVTAASQPVSNRQTLAGALSEPVFAFTLRAVGEDIDVTRVRIEGAAASIDRLELRFAGSSVTIAEATSGQCSTITASRLCAYIAPGALRVEDGDERTIEVLARLKSDAQGAVSAESFALSMTSSTSGHPAIEARGASSNQTLAQNDGDSEADGEIVIGKVTPGVNVTLTGTMHDVVLAKFLDINGLYYPPVNVIPVGEITLGAFVFDAAPHVNSHQGFNDIVLETLRFEVSATNVTLDDGSFELFLASAPNFSAPCTASAATGLINVTCNDLSTIQHVIDQNGSLEIRLRADVTDAQIAPGSSAIATSLRPLGTRGGVSGVLWNDEAASHTWVDLNKTGASGFLYQTP